MGGGAHPAAGRGKPGTGKEAFAGNRLSGSSQLGKRGLTCNPCPGGVSPACRQAFSPTEKSQARRAAPHRGLASKSPHPQVPSPPSPLTLGGLSSAPRPRPPPLRPARRHGYTGGRRAAPTNARAAGGARLLSPPPPPPAGRVVAPGLRREALFHLKMGLFLAVTSPASV